MRGDADRIQTLLENLFRNAVKHGGENVTVQVGHTDDGFYVADNGFGLPGDEQAEIFAYGYTTSNEGTGVGLAIVKRIAEAHGWNVTATDTETGGARFEIPDVEKNDN